MRTATTTTPVEVKLGVNLYGYPNPDPPMKRYGAHLLEKGDVFRVVKYAFNKDPTWVGSKGVLVSQHRASGAIMGRPRYKNKKYSFEVLPYSTVFVCVSVKRRGPETIDVQVITPTGKLMYLLYLSPEDTLQLLDEVPTL